MLRNETKHASDFFTIQRRQGRYHRIDRRHYFKQVLTNPFWDLVDLLPLLGITRQRATQLFQDYFGKNYVTLKRAKKERLNKELACWDIPRHPAHFLSIMPESSHWHGHFMAEVKFIKRLKERDLFWNYDQRRVTSSLRTSFCVNGYYIVVRTCDQPKKVCSRGLKYFRYVVRGVTADFFACYRPDVDSFYIIPGNGARHIYIRSTESDKSWAGTNHEEYLEAWYLLK